MKKIIPAFIALVVGCAIGYLLHQQNKPDTKSLLADKTSLKELIADPAFKRAFVQSLSYKFLPKFTETTIKFDDAKIYIKGFRDENIADIGRGAGLFSGNEANHIKEIGGFVISRTSIENIFKNDGTQTCNGIRIYFAKNPSFLDPAARIFTLVIAGTKAGKGKSVDDSSEDIEDPIYEHVDPCPDNCGGLGDIYE